MNNININRKCSSCMEWKDPKITHKIQEDGLIAPPTKQGTCCNKSATYYRQVTESEFNCASYKPQMILG